MLIDLNVLIDPASGWTLVSAMARNGSGQITGYGTLYGDTRAFLLAPLAKARDAGAADVGATVELSPQHQAEPATARGDRRVQPYFCRGADLNLLEGNEFRSTKLFLASRRVPCSRLRERIVQ
jgi:hypothetical protein